MYICMFIYIYSEHTVFEPFWKFPIASRIVPVPFQGPKKSRFSGPTPSNARHNDVAPFKTASPFVDESPPL